jgi:integrase
LNVQRNLTDGYLRAVSPPATGRLEIRDTRVRGLILRITANATFTWSARTRTEDGRQTRPKLGTWPAMGIAEARKRALAVLSDIQQGGDPVVAKQTARAARLLPTVDDRLREWRAAKAPHWSERYLREVERLCAVEIVPRLGKRPLTTTTRADWTGLITTKHRHAPGVGAMLYRTAAAFLNHAEAHGWIPLPLLPRKGAAVVAPAVGAREHTLSDAELRAIWLAANTLNPKPKAFTHLLLMCGAREMEVADVATSEIDLAAGTWAIPGNRTKNGLGIILPLHALLMEDLRAIWPEDADRAGPAWRLLGSIAGSGLRGFSPVKRLLDKRSGVIGWRFHDLRRTARTGLAKLGITDELAELALNHVSAKSRLVRTYNRHPYADEIISAWSRWQDYVAGLVGEPATPGAQIVRLPRMRGAKRD